MYATVRTYSGNPGLADALVENEDEVKRVVGGIDGFNGYYVVKTDDGAVTISVYNDASGAEESTRAAAAGSVSTCPSSRATHRRFPPARWSSATPSSARPGRSRGRR